MQNGMQNESNGIQKRNCTGAVSSHHTYNMYICSSLWELITHQILAEILYCALSALVPCSALSDQ